MPYKLKKTKDNLQVPIEWFDYPQQALENIVNGCGPAGWKIDLVPDTIWGLSITKACDIHDFCYFLGETLADKVEADKLFLENINVLIANKGGWRWLQALRRRRARTYFNAVSRFGMDAFNHK